MAALTWLVKTMAAARFAIIYYLLPEVFKRYTPTYIKKYPVRPSLECRIQIPRSYQTGSTLPLYIDMHGGGWIAGLPRSDDKFCHYMCNEFNFIVVSLEYRFAPANPFPVPIEDCTELILALLNDPDLPIDPKRVVLAGQSAGGNLALTVSQDPRVRSKIKAIVSFYPSTDFSMRFTGEYRDKPAGPNGEPAVPDSLRSGMPFVYWAYIPCGQDKTDPRLSPVYADPRSLPKHIYLVTSQYDYLAEEAFVTAKRLAKYEEAREDEDWDVNGVKWERVPGEVHGFIEITWGWDYSSTKEDRAFSPQIEAVFGRVGKWLEHVFETP